LQYNYNGINYDNIPRLIFGEKKNHI